MLQAFQIRWSRKNAESATAKGCELIRAIEAGDVDKAQNLIKQGADINTTIPFDNNRSRAIHGAARLGNAEIVEALLERNVEINVREGQWRRETPLHIAIFMVRQHKHAESIRLLVKYGADPTIRNYEGHTARDYVEFIRKDFPELAQEIDDILNRGKKAPGENRVTEPVS